MFSDFKFVFDIDGTICPVKIKSEQYADLIPDSNVVEKMRYYKNNGATIILYTSRNMKTYNGDIAFINKHTAKVLLDWLEKWNIPYDGIVYGKVWPGEKGFYVDDRAIRPKEFLNMTVDKLEELCNQDQTK